MHSLNIVAFVQMDAATTCGGIRYLRAITGECYHILCILLYSPPTLHFTTIALLCVHKHNMACCLSLLMQCLKLVPRMTTYLLDSPTQSEQRWIGYYILGIGFQTSVLTFKVMYALVH